ncbi:MAG: cobalt-dependent transcriptional regulator, partial [Cyanobacteriota bacterium]
NYRLYTVSDVQRLKQIVALKQQGFQLKHIRQLLSAEAGSIASDSLLLQLQQQYQFIIQQLAQLRQTASALEGMLGQDSECQTQRAAQKNFNIDELEQFWQQLDIATHGHPEAFEESLQRLLPDLSGRSEIEVDLLSKLVLACGDVSLVQFVQRSKGAIAAARHALQAGSGVVGDVPAVVNSFDQTRLVGLGCSTTTLIDDRFCSLCFDVCLRVNRTRSTATRSSYWDARWFQSCSCCQTSIDAIGCSLSDYTRFPRRRIVSSSGIKCFGRFIDRKARLSLLFK